MAPFYFRPEITWNEFSKVTPLLSSRLLHLPYYKSLPETVDETLPCLHFPLCKTVRRLRSFKPDGVCIGWEHFQHRTTNETKAETRRITARVEGRSKLIPAGSGLPGITLNCIYRMKITLALLYLAGTCFQKEAGTLLSEDFKKVYVFSSGAHSSRSLFFSDLARRIQPFERTPIFPSILKHIGKWVSLYRLHASVTCSLWKRIQTQHACVKRELRNFSPSPSSDNVQIKKKTFWRTSLFFGGFFPALLSRNDSLFKALNRKLNHRTNYPVRRVSLKRSCLYSSSSPFFMFLLCWRLIPAKHFIYFV